MGIVAPDGIFSLWDHYNLADVVASGVRLERVKAGTGNGRQAHRPDLLLRRHDAARRGGGARGCRGAQVETAHHLCRAELDRFRAAVPRRDRSRSAAPRKRRCFPRLPRSAPTLPFVNIRETAGWSTDAASAGPKMAALLAAAAEPRLISLRQPRQRRRGPDLWPRRTRHRSRQAAHRSSRRHRADQPPADLTPPRVTDFPVVQGQSDPPRAISAPSRSWSTIMRNRALVARHSRIRRGAQRRHVALRSHSRPVRRRAAVSRARSCAMAICAPIRAIRPPCCAPC